MARKILILGLAFVLIVGFSIGSRCANAKIVGAWIFDEGEGEEAKDSSGRDVDGIRIYG